MSWKERKIFAGIAADDAYWDALEAGRFELPRCAGCGAWTWPAPYRCGACGSWDFKWSRIEPKGKIFSWIRSWHSFEGIAERKDDIPYVTVLAEIDGADGARVFGVLRGSEEGLRIGARVRGEILPPSEKIKGYPSIAWVLDK